MTSTHWPPGTKVLLVEDSLPTAKVLEARFRIEGLEVCLAGNGLEALEFLRNEDIALVATDLMMPGMDGFRLIQEIRDLPAPKGDVPILVISSNQQEQSLLRCLSAGADDYMFKPISPRVLVERLKRIYERRRG